jgi:protein translocase SecG subunit
VSIFITVINIFVAIASILLILIVVAQSNKGSDIGLFGGSAEMVFGSQQLTALTRITTILAIIVMGGVFLAGFIKVTVSKNDSLIQEKEKKGQVLKDIVSDKEPLKEGEAKKTVFQNPSSLQKGDKPLNESSKKDDKTQNSKSTKVKD